MLQIEQRTDPTHLRRSDMTLAVSIQFIANSVAQLRRKREFTPEVYRYPTLRFFAPAHMNSSLFQSHKL